MMRLKGLRMGVSALEKKNQLVNGEKEPLEIIELQKRVKVIEEDIVRFENNMGGNRFWKVH